MTYRYSRNVLGVRIDDLPFNQSLAKVTAWLEEKNLARPRVIVTPGPEFLLTAQKDEEFRRILNASNLSLPDGFGLRLFGGVKNRVPGVDFMLALCQKAVKEDWSIGLLGGREGVAGKAAANLRKQFP